MSSSTISTININPNFPVSGQNNSSQGFRDNFAAIKQAIDTAANEINEIQKITKNALVKQPIEDAPRLDNDLGYSSLIRAQLKGFTETFYDNGEIGHFVSLDFSRGNFQKITTTMDVNVSLLNFPKQSHSGRLLLWVNTTNFGHRLFFGEALVTGALNNYIKGKVVLLPYSGNYLIEIRSLDSGTRFWVAGIEGFGGSGGSTNINTDSTITSVSSIDQSPIASVSKYGFVKIDGTTIGIDNGTISVIGGPSTVGATGPIGPQGNIGSTGPTGPIGFTGATGLHITGITITNGNLYISKNDLSVVDAGNVVGATGPRGDPTPLFRSVITATTPTALSNNQSTDLSFTGFKVYHLLKIKISRPAWVRLYATAADRTADIGRSQGTDPTPDSGIICEVITSTPNQSVRLTPGIMGFNDDDPPTPTMYARVTSLSSTIGTISIDFTLVQAESAL